MKELLEAFYANKSENVPRMSLEEAESTGLLTLILKDHEQTDSHF